LNSAIQYTAGKFWANNHVHVVRGNSGVNTRFLYHYLRTFDFIPYLPNKDRAKLTKGEMIKIPIPIPPLAEQARIVAILDKFDALTSSISEGLPREIELRQKQYEYYRDQLLNFPKPEDVTKHYGYWQQEAQNG
jgi:type I restriction enzyme S subunit